MPQLTEHELAALKARLEQDYLPHLPPLLNPIGSVEQQRSKNLSRSLAAFAVSIETGWSAQASSAAVIDDFDDRGVDAVAYEPASKVLYLFQSKLQQGAEFRQEDATSFLNGVTEILRLDLDRFNANVAARRAEIVDAVENCDAVRVIIIHVGERISANADRAMQEFTRNPPDDDDRAKHPYKSLGPDIIRAALSGVAARKKVNARLPLHRARTVTEPRAARFGVVWLKDLVSLYREHGDALFDTNLRNHLGTGTAVNEAIQRTLVNSPENFFYLNNGVTALAERIVQRNSRDDVTNLDLGGLTIINGAQTIASAAEVLAENSTAKVHLTIVNSAAGEAFGKAVTQARNSQNAVTASMFAGLDSRQEEIRRALSHFGLIYAYKSEPRSDDAKVIRFDEVVAALALRSENPRNAWRLAWKAEKLKSFGHAWYEELFAQRLEPQRIANEVFVWRSMEPFLQAEARRSDIVKHGQTTLAWAFAKRLRAACSGPRLLDAASIEGAISADRDHMREQLEAVVTARQAQDEPRPAAWALFRNQEHALELAERLLLSNFGMAPDHPAVRAARARAPSVVVRGRARPQFDYPQPLFAYLCAQAPQIQVP